MFRAKIISESIHGNPGERRVLPVGALCVVVPADNLPPADPPQYWAGPLIDGRAAGWPDDTAAWSRSVGVLVSAHEFERI
jgi:hypothetical protein